MDQLIAFTVIGIVTGSVYAVGASGLVLTYATSGIFNIAHGAIGMLMAFTYWELSVNRGWPAWVALPMVLFVLAPAMGAVIERTLMRGLRDASVGTSLVVTVGLMVTLLGVAQAIWSPSDARQLPGFFEPSGFDLGPVFVSWHEALTIVAGAAVALSLWLFLTRTRTGIAMRAVVDDRNLLSLNGARPHRVSGMSWAIGSSLAALSGILLAPVLQMNVTVLTLLVINAYAAAMVGRLMSLPLTFAGAMALGLVESYAVGFLDLRGWLQGLRPALPTLFLFAILLLLPQDRLRAGRLAGAVVPRIPGMRRSLEGGAIMVGVAIVLSFMLGDADISRVSQGIAFALIMLSLVPLTGYGGQVSLCQMSFAGVGAFAMARMGGDGSIVGIVAAIALAAIAGALVSLPALRLQGLYLALATMAFAVFMDTMVFPQTAIFGNFGSLKVGRLDLLGISFDSERMYLILLAVVFAGMGVFVLWLRRGPFGRLLAAMRDSQVACATLGLSLARTKLAVFMLSAAMAGLAGALFGGLRSAAGPGDFIMLQSLPILLLAVVGGINTVAGALIGGISLALMPLLQEAVESVDGLTFMLAGLAAVLLGRNPNGIVAVLMDFRPRDLLDRLRPPPAAKPEEVSRAVAPTG